MAVCSGQASGTDSEGRSIQNELESVVCRQYPVIDSCLNWLNRFSQARMSGSGSSVFAEFASRAEAESILEKLAQEYAGTIDEYPIRGFAASGMEKHPLHHLAE